MRCSGRWVNFASPVRLGPVARRGTRWPTRVGAEVAPEVQSTPPVESSPSAVTEALSRSEGGVDLPPVTKALETTARDAWSNFGQSADSALGSAKKLSDKTAETLTSSAKAASETVSSALEAISKEFQSSVGGVTEQTNTLAGEANKNAQAVLDSLEKGAALLQQQALDAVPVEVKEAYSAAQPFLQKATDIAATYRTPLAVAGALLLGVVGFSYYRGRFVGYAGDILPEKVLELLESDAPALLVDIRSETAQSKEGIPSLRRRALGKAISVPYCRADPSLDRILSVTPQLTADVTATYIAGHKQAATFTDFVVMAESEDQGRRVARSLCSMDCPNSFVMLGGFSAWKAAALPVLESPSYDITPIDVLSDRALDLTELLEEPRTLIPASLGAVGIAWSIWNYQYVLELLGVLGPTLGLVAYLLKKYDSLDEVLDDLDKILKRFAETSRTEPLTQPEPSIEAEEAAEGPIREGNETAVAES